MAQHTTDILTMTAIGDLAVVVTVSAGFVLLARKIRQPAVVGEIAAGIAFGPSVLGLLPGHLTARLFPATVHSYLSAIADVGLLLFMFSMGWEFDRAGLIGRRKQIGLTWLCSTVLPLGLGMALAAVIYRWNDEVGGNHLSQSVFTLYLGLAMTITAFPVLARIIEDWNLKREPVGALSLALAAADDVLAWCVLAVVIAMASSTGPAGLVRTVCLSVVFIVFLFAVVRPALSWLSGRLKTLSPSVFSALIAAGALGSAYITWRIGIHEIFGAFVFGLVMPRQQNEGWQRIGLTPLVHVSKLLMPVFFVTAGLSVDFTSLGPTGAWELLAVIVVACLSKLGGVTVAARVGGASWRESTILGLLMNTRGLTQLVVLNVGLQYDILNVELYTAMVTMAVVTTAMAGPLLSLLLGNRTHVAAAPVDLVPEPVPIGVGTVNRTAS
jgi:Kef-type K+ transport system membrane component KefB